MTKIKSKIRKGIAWGLSERETCGTGGDQEGQREVLLKTLEVLEKTKQPGEIGHLPFTWPEEPKKTDWQPPEMSPLIKFYLEDIKKARREQEGQVKAKS
ncbi:MAG: hypothetical protein A2157_18355 [Deltaproteobacteria bacterium RBG_16_47_11]|nr:MAG: hypothetical protein A2157_18355 [Deltaproteobacteria bacterium RBG_16_47_11]